MNAESDAGLRIVRILAVSDIVSREVYDQGIKARFRDVDLAISCGDLPYYYLEYIVSTLNIPLLYVHGNHDQPLYTEREVIRAPRGCTPVEGRVVRVHRLLVGGLGGSIRYKPTGKHQYTESEMRWRLARMEPGLYLNRLRYGHGLDVFIAHASPHGIHDQEDRPHHGFKAFNTLIHRYHPRYFLHGHTYPKVGVPTRSHVEDTEVIHVYGYKVLEVQVGKA